MTIDGHPWCQTYGCQPARFDRSLTAWAAKWEPIGTAPIDLPVLLFCPERHFTNRERIEVGPARTSSGSSHAWATHWSLLPDGPDPADVDRILADEAERDYREREMEQLSHDGQL